MARLRALLPPAVAQSREGMLSPVSSGPVSLRHARSAELEAGVGVAQENQTCQAADAASVSHGGVGW